MGSAQYRPNTAGPGGQGRDRNGNAIGSRMPGQFVIGGAPRMGGPAYGGRPNPGDLYQRPGFGQPSPAVLPPEGQPGNFRPGNRFQPGGMLPPAGGRIGNPRQFNPGQGGMRPGGPTPMPMPNPIDPGFGAPIQMPSPGGGGKGGMPGPKLGPGGGGKGGFQGPMDPRAGGGPADEPNSYHGQDNPEDEPNSYHGQDDPGFNPFAGPGP